MTPETPPDTSPATPSNPPDRLALPLADDWHIHLRDGAALQHTVADAARCFRRLVAMPNLQQPLTNVASAEDYHRRLQQALPAGAKTEILIPLYLTDRTSVGDIEQAAQSRIVCGAKLYPAGATTLSHDGVADLSGLEATLAAMEKADLPLLVHAEVTDPEIDIFDRETAFIDRYLLPWSDKFPALRIVVEHISTAAAVAFVSQARNGIAATITAHHMLLNRNDLLAGCLRPHAYCLPVVKRESDRKAVLGAATSGSRRFFLGTDSAPHARTAKESACGCAGIYTAHAALELYAEAFEQANALHRLPAFACEHGAMFYRQPVSTLADDNSLVLHKKPWQVAEQLPYPNGDLVPFYAGRTLNWQLQTASRADG